MSRSNLTRIAAGPLLVIALLTGCQGERPVQGFVLPPGNAVHGQQVFVQYGCNGCHSIPDVALPEREAELPFVVALGGEVMRVKTYGELLTAIVYPTHVVLPKYRNLLLQVGTDPDRTPMPYFGDTMTVTELIDLTEFLHGQYTRLLPDYYKSHYPAIR